MTGIGIGAGLGMLVGHSCIYAPGTLSAQFDGVNQYIDFGNNPASTFTIDDPFTFACWFKTSDANDQALLQKFSTNGIRFEVTAAGRVHVILFDSIGAGAGAWLQRYTTATTYAGGAWHSAAFSYDGSRTVAGLKLFLGGAQPATTGVEHNPADINLGAGVPLTVSGWLSDRFNGNICHSAVWDIEMTPTNLNTITGAGNPMNLLGDSACCDFSAGLVHWSTDGDGCAIGAGNCLDISGEVDHGTYTNSDGTDFVLDYP